MLKINIIAVGKIKERYFSDATAEYVKRISRFADIKVIEVSEAPPAKSEEERKTAESAELLRKARGFVIAMDGSAPELSSSELAGLIAEKQLNGISELSFLIGGSDGHGKEALKHADKIVSFGKVTYPHQLFRVILAEQLYRALTILANVPYNK